MRLKITNRTRREIPAPKIRNDIKKALLKMSHRKNQESKPSGLNVVFVSDAESRILNRAFLKKNYPANVLSFDYGSEAELILAPSAIQREAISIRRPYAMELRRMVIHGLLHILGYHHEASRSRAGQFETLERELLTRLKIY